MFLEPPTVGLLGLRNFELPAVGLPELCKQLTGESELRVIKKGLRKREGDAGSSGGGFDGSYPDSDQSSRPDNSEG